MRKESKARQSAEAVIVIGRNGHNATLGKRKRIESGESIRKMLDQI